ncbi:MAG TPA: hypothetical protein DEO71_15200 [Chryseobacterium sp.]|nr:hypothetical protein [Chryseobacterium sp.]
MGTKVWYICSNYPEVIRPRLRKVNGQFCFAGEWSIWVDLRLKVLGKRRRNFQILKLSDSQIRSIPKKKPNQLIDAR